MAMGARAMAQSATPYEPRLHSPPNSPIFQRDLKYGMYWRRCLMNRMTLSGKKLITYSQAT